MDSPVRYLSTGQVAERIGVQPGTLSRYKLPDPDVIVGSGARPTFGWLPETIDTWNAQRPGRGNWGKHPQSKLAHSGLGDWKRRACVT